MLKKLALIGIFAVASVVSFGGTSRKAEATTTKGAATVMVGSPVMKALCANPMGFGCPR